MAKFEIWQGGAMVASAESPETHVALREIARYAAQYEIAGPIEIREVKPRKAARPTPAAEGG